MKKSNIFQNFLKIPLQKCFKREFLGISIVTGKGNDGIGGIGAIVSGKKVLKVLEVEK
ncbi:MAG: hypothetical protein LBN34_07765 [Clostridiales Family XIII bacterium]|jgi:hypothetical protein|nr:hypothetical protein [Clostridiales Family XIII bacterium]